MTYVLVDNFKRDNGNGDSFQVIFESPIDLGEATRELARHYSAHIGDEKEFEAFDSTGCFHAGGVIDPWNTTDKKYGKNLEVTPSYIRSAPCDTYTLQEKNMHPGQLQEFYDFLSQL